MCVRRANKTIQFNELKIAKADMADEYFKEIMKLEESTNESLYALEMHKKTSSFRDKLAELEKQMEYILYEIKDIREKIYREQIKLEKHKLINNAITNETDANDTVMSMISEDDVEICQGIELTNKHFDPTYESYGRRLQTKSKGKTKSISV